MCTASAWRGSKMGLSEMGISDFWYQDPFGCATAGFKGFEVEDSRLDSSASCVE